MRQNKPQSPQKKKVEKHRDSLAVMVLRGAFASIIAALIASCFTDPATRTGIINGVFELAKGAIFVVLGFYFASKSSPGDPGA
ncbi:hypothetical protein [Deinococcus cellulosilyticus]|uniref:hypothetical protein n=1 Tax=Deinococcus cellulosilyticus TaxID=401558 RepID=UPI0011BF10DB|nr:hypothetical protein [Deinococcus cellulosilyticus]